MAQLEIFFKLDNSDSLSAVGLHMANTTPTSCAKFCLIFPLTVTLEIIVCIYFFFQSS